VSLKLVIGNKNYSSWSLRGWLALAQAGLEFEEIRIPLSRPESKEQILRYSPSGKVPCLIDDGLTIFDSLAICEYINEQYAAGRLWPRDPGTRARARAVAAEMHSGFAPLRTHMSMEIRARYPERGAAAQQREDVAADIARIKEVWTECLAAGGPLLFGEFSIADAFYAPVVTRFATYGVALPGPLAAYSDRVIALPSMQRWIAAARTEAETIE
jgi:glutathione S-transferase